MRVLAVDPGREKCGVAVCGPEGVVARRVVRVSDLAGVARDWVTSYGVDAVVVGDQTGCAHVFALLRDIPVQVEAAVEHLIPTDELGPGARDAGVVVYIDRALASTWGVHGRQYRGGPWLEGTPPNKVLHLTGELERSAAGEGG